MRREDLNYWHYLAIFFAIFTIVVALGEWVFHWWDEPGELFSAAGAMLTLLSLGFAASRSELRGFRREQQGTNRELLAGQRELLAGQRELIAGQARQTQVLEEVVASFRGRQS